MTTFFSYLTQHKIPSRATLRALLTPPLTWYGFILYSLIAAILIVAYSLLLTINNHFLVTVPARGGTITEGMIGAPHVINPVLATTETDTSLTSLVYAGLLRATDTEGGVMPELAQAYTVSPDGLTYTFTLRDKLKWSDQKPLTSADVLFTIEKLANANLNHTMSNYWQNISVSTPTPLIVVITLPEARSDFLAHMTVGILPQHIWATIPDETFADAPQNLAPVGSGMYVFDHIENENGIPRQIDFNRNPRYALGRTYIDHYRVVIFPNQTALLEALQNGDIDMTLAATPATAVQVTNTDFEVQKITSPYNVTLFHQANEPILSNQKLVRVLNDAIDKTSIIATVENGYGILTPTHVDTASATEDDIFAELKSLGYTYENGTLSRGGAPIGFSIAVENEELALRAAQTLANELGTFGMIVTVKAFDPGTFQDRLQSAEYQVFLASQNDVAIPRTYEPVLTLYQKAYPFITKKSTILPIPPYLPLPGDRYLDARDWHVRVDKVWKIFSRSNK